MWPSPMVLGPTTSAVGLPSMAGGLQDCPLLQLSSTQTHSPRFAEIWTASLALTLPVSYHFAYRRRIDRKCLAPASPFAVATRGRSFPPEDRPPHLRAVG